MFINLYMAKMCTRFWRESLMFKLINRYGYIESMVFHEIWPERSLIDKEQKGVKQNSSISNTFLATTTN